jgi:pyruvate/2-oxoglutarate dehydrogenase complex dihydrolipoamide acyltransferase (E2) component
VADETTFTESPRSEAHDVAGRRIRAGAERLEPVLRIWVGRHRDAGQSDDELAPRLARILRPLAGSLPIPVRNAVAAEEASRLLHALGASGAAADAVRPDAAAAAPPTGESAPTGPFPVESPPPARLSPETRRAIEEVRLSLHWEELVSQSGGRLVRFVPGRRPGRRRHGRRRQAGAERSGPLTLPNYLHVIKPRPGRRRPPSGSRRNRGGTTGS